MKEQEPQFGLDEKPHPLGRVITFYSYKGGTGRSMAVANVAWILASNSQRVLVIDWDFEAPGLHRYFRPFLPDPELADTPGLIDCFVHFAEAARIEAATTNVTPTKMRQTAAPTSINKSSTTIVQGSSKDQRAWFKERANLLRYSVPLDHDFGDGALHFVAAGKQGPSYSLRVNSFDWPEFYEKLGGGIFLEAMKAQLREEYDYVLIDSRTGLSDTSGICTVQMPDELVVCFTLNRQSIFGAAATAESADAQRRLRSGQNGIRIWPVPTRVELSEKDRLEAARLLAKEKMAGFLWHVPARRRQEYWGEVEMLYFPYYAFEEVLATLADPPQQSASLLACLERLTSRLTQTRISRMPSLAPGMRENLLAKYGTGAAASVSSQVASSAPQFYLSYAKADDSLPIVRRIGAALDQQFGSRCVFWDERVPFGVNWAKALDEGMRKAQTVLVVIGPKWHQSAGSLNEVRQAISLNKPVIPLLVNEAAWEQVPEELRAFRGSKLSGEHLNRDLEELAVNLAQSPPVMRALGANQPLNVDDPQRGQWGGQSRNDWPGRELKARVTLEKDEWFRVSLTVATTSDIPLKGDVEFHLHPTFRPPVMKVPAINGRAELDLIAFGAFTAGVLADNGSTRLELNLAELPDVPELFRER